jgi:hypothetical protein
MSKYTKELLEPIVKTSTSFTEVLRQLKIPQSGGMQSHIKRQVVRFGIDHSHFKGQAHSKGRVGPRPKLYWMQVLVERTSDSHKPDASRLRRALIESGRVYQCEECSNTGLHNNKPLVLQVDHKNGNPYDHRPDNLRFLCPNCHSQTDNWSGRGIKPKANKDKKLCCCIDCNKKIGPRGKRCVTCSNRANANKYKRAQKIVWPGVEELRAMLAVSPYTVVAKQLGVSDNSIRKHLSKCITTGTVA